MTTRRSQYWDSCLFIEFLTKQVPQRAKPLRHLFEQASKGHLEIVVSNLVLTEVQPNSATDGDSLRAVSDLLEVNRPYVRFYAVSRQIALDARALALAHQTITCPDAIHIATAIRAGVDEFLTYDGEKRKKERRSGKLLALDGKIGNPPLRHLFSAD